MHEFSSKHAFLPDICIVACSPRADGNSDHVAHVFSQGIHDACSTLNCKTPNIKTLYLRDFNIIPCIGCNACFVLKKCIYAEKDDVDYLFSCIKQAEHIFLTSPIFFYHLPATAKAFMDRAQQFYVQRIQEDGNVLTTQDVSVALVAARKQGENLFKGTLWSLRYFFDVFPMKITKNILLKGFDDKGELAQDALACAQIKEHAKDIVQKLYTPPA